MVDIRNRLLEARQYWADLALVVEFCQDCIEVVPCFKGQDVERLE